MDIRKRKRVLKHSLSYAKQLFSLRSFILSFVLIVFVLVFTRDIRFGSGGFRPARIVPNLSVFSSSVSNSIQDLPSQDDSSSSTSVSNTRKISGFKSGSNSKSKLSIESRLLFSDHALMVLSTNGEAPRLGGRIDCVYWMNESSNGVEALERRERERGNEIVALPMLSADEYDGGKWIVRCPMPPANDSAMVGLRGRREGVAGGDWTMRAEKDRTVRSWSSVVYGATMDGEDTVAVFAKGLNLRSDRESYPTPFRCRFEVEGSEGERRENVVLRTKAITAAQEIIRCPLPPALREKTEEVQVSLEVVSYRGSLHHLVPSIAKIHRFTNKENYRHELCACTMVWNQAAFIREWITYHSWLGVQRWFLYDNNSDDGLKEVIDELVSENYNISRHSWPWVKSQEAGFSHCVLRAREQCSWVAFFDVDEFYYFPPPKREARRSSNLDFPRPDSLLALVGNVSTTSPSVGEIRTDCLSYGPSGLTVNPPAGVTIGYTCRLRSPERHKSIVRPEAINSTLLNQVHLFSLKKEFKKMSLLPSTALINHYKYQVWDVFKAKFYRRVSTYVADWQENQNENSRDRAPGLGTEAIEPPDWHKRFCEVWDNRLRDFILANLADRTTGLLPWRRPPQ